MREGLKWKIARNCGFEGSVKRSIYVPTEYRCLGSVLPKNALKKYQKDGRVAINVSKKRRNVRDCGCVGDL